jgi:sec-independent protein translocase protein TatC
VVGAIFTPPDVVSQVMLAVPLWILYELGIFVSQWISKPAAEETQSGSAS